MKKCLVDAYRENNKVILWLKANNKNIREEHDFTTCIYVESTGKRFLKDNNISFKLIKKRTYMDELIEVCEIPVPNIMEYERFIANIEKKAKHKLMLYNADISPEQQFLYKNKLAPGDASLSKCTISFNNNTITLNNKEYNPQEFVKEFEKEDPDIIIMRYAFANLPKLEQLLLNNNLESPFHRWDKTRIKYKGGKTFFSYGNTVYKDFAIRLKGRLLIDTASIIGNECDVEGILELCRLTGARFQQIASRSYGAIFQHSLTRLLFEKDYLIPFKEKPIDQPISMIHLLAGDNAGHRFDAKTGYHEDVAEIDFSSMFPWIIYKENISAETILKSNLTAKKVPRLPIYISQEPKGIIPQAIKPLIDKRMEYKENPTSINQERSKALKFVLVTAYGYLRFREFKLGIATSHMAICAYAREIILKASKLAEERGFTIVHGIVDSLFIKKKSITESEVKLLCKDIQALVGIPVTLDGIFKWVIFLPSINDPYRPLPATYYGVFNNKTIKYRGIESRQRRIPKIIRLFQQRTIEDMALQKNRKDIISKIPQYCANIRKVMNKIDEASPENLAYTVRISKTDYKNNIAQRIIVRKYQERGLKLYPGQTIEYIHEHGRIVLPDEYSGVPDRMHYRRLLERSLFNIFQPLGITRGQIIDWSGVDYQSKINDFVKEETIIDNELSQVVSIES